MSAPPLRTVTTRTPASVAVPAPRPAVPRPAGRPASGGRLRWSRLLPLLAAVALLTRLPSFLRQVWSPDEGYLATQARMLAAGGSLYDTVVDRKPPLLPWLYQGAFALFGDDSLLPLRVAAVFAQFATAALLAAVALHRWGPRAGWAAGVLFLLVSLGLNPQDTQAATFEVFILPFTVAAVRCAERRHWAAAGLCVAAAALTKQTGGAVLLPVLWLLWRQTAPGRRAPAVRRTACGLVLPVLGAALATEPSGFLFWTVTGSGEYASFTGSEMHVLLRAVASAMLLSGAAIGLLAALAEAGRRASSGCPAAGGRAPDLWLWLVASAVAVAAGFHFFGHYYLQLVPPLVLLGTAALAALPPVRAVRRALTTVVPCLAFLVWGLLAPRPELDHARQVAAAVRARTPAGARVFIWGMHPEQYWLAGRTPASRYLTAGLLTNFSGGRDGPRVGEKYAVRGGWAAFHEEMRTGPPELIVDDSRGKPYAPERVPPLRSLLRARYEPVATVDGAVLYGPRKG
ncbi:glycosyltransferase family 39 protein [Streptomyces meridianus]|uniref:Glycosyltransferase family 39 protein n=1 Tax=Streptomyces meridianus TaxID=2938945 RepID=A0ABT0X335_9ACTN|nr:glycosyltransferase family 39 protein [Streptomyces meridianus]MCM2576955.1 glycosyltransferase family 39 protein [Streptomyces meridianus]